MIKNLPAMRETWFHSLGWEDPLKEGMATQSSILAWRIPMDRGAWQATVHRVAKSRTCVQLSTQHTLFFKIKISETFTSKGSSDFVEPTLLAK